MKNVSKKKKWLMFDRIAKQYDWMNRLMTLGLDKSWRLKINSALPNRKELKVLDLATGTADVPLVIVENNADVKEVIGMDMSIKMLEYGSKKVAEKGYSHKVNLEKGDAQDINKDDQQFDAVSISFGIRNVEDHNKTLKEMYRVLNDGGKCIILETSLPKNVVLKWGHTLYMTFIMPLLGWIITRNRKAYQYLSQSTSQFPDSDTFCQHMQEVGFSSVRAYPQTWGVTTLYIGTK